MFTEIHTAKELENYIAAEKALLIYFSSNNCNVCKTLKPKVDSMIVNEFPGMISAFVKIDDVPKAAGQYHIFTVPVVLVFFQGKETIRKSRNFSIEELYREIHRPYSLLF